MLNNCCAFTGHRPHKFPWRYDETDSQCVALKEALAGQITLPDTAADLLNQYDEACEELEAVTERKQKAENLLKEMMGDNEVGTAGDRIVTWKSVSQERLDGKTMKAEHPKLCKKYINKISFRRFEVKTAS